MRVIAAIMDDCVIKAILECQGLPSQKPRLTPSRAPPGKEEQPNFEFSQIPPNEDSFF